MPIASKRPPTLRARLVAYLGLAVGTVGSFVAGFWLGEAPLTSKLPLWAVGPGPHIWWILALWAAVFGAFFLYADRFIPISRWPRQKQALVVAAYVLAILLVGAIGFLSIFLAAAILEYRRRFVRSPNNKLEQSRER